MRKKGVVKRGQIETMTNLFSQNFFKYSDDYYPVNILKEDYLIVQIKPNIMHTSHR